MSGQGTLVYVDHPLAVQVAANLIGLTEQRSSETRTSAAINWLISAERAGSKNLATGTDYRAMLPEDLYHYMHPNIRNRFGSLEECIDRFSAGSGDAFAPGTVISVEGKLIYPSIKRPAKSDPMKGGETGFEVVFFHGEPCLPARLESGSYWLPTYFRDDAASQVVHVASQSVTLDAIVRWIAPFSPGGARASTFALRAFAVSLR